MDLIRTPGRQYRTVSSDHFRAIEKSGVPSIDLKVVQYGVLDEYGSVWAPGCFDRSLGERMPTLCFDWNEIIGRATAPSRDATGPVVSFRFDDFFVKDKQMIRAEIRELLAITSPQRFAKATVTWS